MRTPVARMGGLPAAAALLAALALSSCSTLGFDPVGAEAGKDEAVEATEGESSASDAAQALPEPGQDASDGIDAEAPPPDDDASEDDAGGETPDDIAPADPQAPVDAAAAADAPHVYMSLQPDTGGSTSVVFAIDRSRDGTPSDEPAIRITPEATEAQSGRCNPQQLRYYKFPPESAGQPVYGPDEASRGVAAGDLPGFMATAVSAEMMELGIADDLDGTRPQNVCTRKLFEQTIIAASTGQG